MARVHEIDVTAASRPFWWVKWASVVLFVSAVLLLAGLPAQFVHVLGAGAPMDVVWTALGAAAVIVPLAMATAWVTFRNVGGIRAVRRPAVGVVFAASSVIMGLLALLSVTTLAEPLDEETLFAVISYVILSVPWAASALIGLVALFVARFVRIRGLDLRLPELIASVDVERVARRAPPRNPGWGAFWVVAGFAWFAAFSFGTDLLLQLSQEVQGLSGGLQQLQFLGFLMFLVARYNLQPSPEAVLADGRVPAALYLRTFSDDDAAARQTNPGGNPASALLDNSLEARLADHFGRAGPFVAVGVPGRRNQFVIGATRVHLSNDAWQAQVVDWMKQSGHVVYQPGVGDWAGWELEQLIERGWLDKTIFLMPEFAYNVFLPWRTHRRDVEPRLEALRRRFAGTRWATALADLGNPKRIRAFVVHDDGSLTLVVSRNRSRNASHIALLVALHAQRPARLRAADPRPS